MCLVHIKITYCRQIAFLILILLGVGCRTSNSEMKNGDIKIEIIKDSREMIMESTEPWESLMLGYYTVLKIEENLWYMWYQAWETLEYTDYGVRLCFAYSSDGKNWIKKIPGNNEKGNNIIVGEESKEKEGWVESCVFIDPNDKSYPYRIIYNKLVEGEQKAFMAKSINGWDWIENKLILNSFHDTQYSVNVLSNGNYYVLLRMWENENLKNELKRIIGYAIIKPDGEIITQPTPLVGSNLKKFPHVYTNSATFINDSSFVMIPTFFSNNNKMAIKMISYSNGEIVFNPKNDFTNILYEQPTGWGNVCPGLIETNIPNEYWMYYYRRIGKHDNVQDYTTYYYRIKVRINFCN